MSFLSGLHPSLPMLLTTHATSWHIFYQVPCPVVMSKVTFSRPDTAGQASQDTFYALSILIGENLPKQHSI